MTLLAEVNYTGTGITGPYTLPFSYLDESHVNCTVDGVTATFTFASATTITLDSAAATDTAIRIWRDSDNTTPAVDFSDGSVLTEADLDTSVLHLLYVAQETNDAVANKLGKTTAGDNWDAASIKIENLATPTADGDAATKAYADTQSSLAAASAAAASASETAASTSASAASSSASAASSSASAASASASAASASETAAAASAASLAGSTVPDGGTAGQYLTKIDGTDGNTQWSTLGALGAKDNVETADITNDAVTFEKLLNATAAGLIGANATGAFEEIAAASQAEMEAGTVTALRGMTPANIKQAIDALSPGISAGSYTSIGTGTTHDITGISSDAKLIHLVYDSLSSDGTSDFTIQLGDAGGIETSNYTGQTNDDGGSSVTSPGSYIPININNNAANSESGIITLALVDPATNTWILTGKSFTTNSTFSHDFAGRKSLSGTLDRIRLSSVSGDTFDGGNYRIFVQ